MQAFSELVTIWYLQPHYNQMTTMRCVSFPGFRNSLLYAANVGTHRKNAEGENHVSKSRLLSSTKGAENRIEL